MRSELDMPYTQTYHNRGYATEMFRAVLHALLSSGYASVAAGAFEQNQAGIRVMQKCGMTQTDREEVILYHGKSMRCVYFAINAPK